MMRACKRCRKNDNAKKFIHRIDYMKVKKEKTDLTLAHERTLLNQFIMRNHSKLLIEMNNRIKV